MFEVLGTNSESRMNVWMNVGEPSSNLTTIILVIEINIVEYLDECWNAAAGRIVDININSVLWSCRVSTIHSWKEPELTNLLKNSMQTRLLRSMFSFAIWKDHWKCGENLGSWHGFPRYSILRYINCKMHISRPQILNLQIPDRDGHWGVTSHDQQQEKDRG